MPLPTETRVYEDSRTPRSSTYTLRNPNGGPWSYDSSGVSVRTYRKGLRRPKPKQLDPTPYEMLKHTDTGIQGEWRFEAPGWFSLYRGTYAGGFLGDPNIASVRYRNGEGFDFSPDVQDTAMLKALSSLNLKDVDLGTALAEFGKTAGVVGDLAHLTVDCLKFLRKRDLRGFLDRLKPDVTHRLPHAQSVVDTYLTYHYAIKPALQEVAGAVQALTRKPSEDARVTVKARHMVDGENSKVLDLGAYCYVQATSTYRDSCRVLISAVRRNINSADDIRWALGLDDPLSTAWELTPFSFVYDWMVPVGDWLAAVNASKYYTDWQVSSTQYLKEVTTYSGTTKAVSGGVATSNVRGVLDTFKLRRNVRSVLPMVGVPFKNPVSVDHMAKGLSLLATALARGGEVPRYLRY